MNILSIFKVSHRWNQMINRLLMISLWCAVILFFAIAVGILMGSWSGESIRMALIISGIGVVLLIFTIFTKRSFDQQQAPKTLQDYYECALDLEEAKGLEACKEIYETICNSFDTHVGPAYLTLASIYLEKNEEERAIEYIHKAARDDWIWYHSGLELLAEYYKKNQLLDQLEKLTKQLERIKELEEEASQEIYYMSESDSFLPNDRPLYTFASIIRVLLSYLKLNELFIVQKTLTTIPDRKVYVFALVVDQKDEAQQYEEQIYRDCYEFLAKPLGKYIFFEYTVSFIFLSRRDLRDRRFLQKIENIKGARVNQYELDALFSD